MCRALPPASNEPYSAAEKNPKSVLRRERKTILDLAILLWDRHKGMMSSLNFRRIALVSGYHSCSFPPLIAFDAGLRNRFAVVFDTYRPQEEGMFFDADLFLDIVEAFLRTVPYDRLDIEMGGKYGPLQSASELKNWYACHKERVNDPPLRMRCWSENLLVAVEETELWVNVGGPDVYHDSITASFYTAVDSTDELRILSERVCNEKGAIITGFHEADARKDPFVPLWKRPFRWLGVKPW